MGMYSLCHQEMMWQRPCGSRISRYAGGGGKFNQQPLLHICLDRKGGNHISLISEGHFIASTGQPRVHASHIGDYLGSTTNSKLITTRFADLR
jgi:hypothetical protein